MKNKVLLFLLSLLGFSACENVNEMPCAYGTPTSHFTIKGRVTDETGNPVKGLLVMPENARYVEIDEGKVTPSDHRDHIFSDSQVYTDETGRYETKGECFGFDNFIVELSVQDVDGTENGGDFGKHTAEVLVLEKDRVSQGSWVEEYVKQADDIQVGDTNE